MANPEHLAILNQGVEVWNKWRDENHGIDPDLREANLSGFDLTKANLICVNLSGANLEKTALYSAWLDEANLTGANLRNTDLRTVDLSFVKLTRANLTGADLSNACIINANLSRANLREANLFDANLSGANLREADLVGANLVGAKLREADLQGSQVIYANCQTATLTGACIKDWLINSETKLDAVICEYVYLDVNKKERRPINGNFEPGEFASLYKKIIENTDLIISKTLAKDNTINNQGVQFYSDSTIHTWERLRFRSKTEIKIAEALDRTGVLFVPNSLARLNTPKGRGNKEADFLICYKGKWGVLEVDGPFHTPERRVEEQERERIFKKNGIKVVERFNSERCYNNPDEVVQEFFKMIEIGYS
jgi:uncharacterized protein YjbI with pentapeptide repeats/very-short-patch-repair endonuclease